MRVASCSIDQAGEFSWSRPPGLHRHRSLTGRGSCGWTRAAWLAGRSATPKARRLEPMAGIEPACAAEAKLPLRRGEGPRSGLTKTVDCRYPTPAWCPREGVAPPSLPCHGSGLLLTYVGEIWSGSGDPPSRLWGGATEGGLALRSSSQGHLPRGAKEGRCLPLSPWRERRELHPLWLGHSQPCKAVTLRPQDFGAPRWIRTNIPRLSSACPALGRGVRGAASGFRPRDLLVGNEASYSLDYGRVCFFWLPGQESNLQLAVSRTALRTDTECLAK